MNCKQCWRKLSKDIAKGESCPETIEALQAHWEKDQETIFKMKEEISTLKSKLNQCRQKLK